MWEGEENGDKCIKFFSSSLLVQACGEEKKEAKRAGWSLAARSSATLCRSPTVVMQVPDTLLLESSVTPKAATVSSLLLSWVLSNEQLGMKLYQVSRQHHLPGSEMLPTAGL